MPWPEFLDSAGWTWVIELDAQAIMTAGSHVTPPGSWFEDDPQRFARELQEWIRDDERFVELLAVILRRQIDAREMTVAEFTVGCSDTKTLATATGAFCDALAELQRRVDQGFGPRGGTTNGE